MSFLDDLFGSGDLSTIDQMTLPDDWASMDSFDPSTIGSIDPWDAMGDPNSYGMDTGWVVPPDSGFSQNEWNQLLDYNNGMGGGLGDINADSGGGLWQSIGRMITGSKNPTAGGVLAGLIPMALGGLSGAMNRSATNDATAQTLAGLQKASDQATQLINGASQGYQPFMQAGTSALSKLSSQAPSNLAAQFAPLAGQFAPLGSGRGAKSPGGR